MVRLGKSEKYRGKDRVEDIGVVRKIKIKIEFETRDVNA
jgi:hypothetical protein